MCFSVVTLVTGIQHYSRRGPSWLAPEGCLCPSVHQDSARPLQRIGLLGCLQASVSLRTGWGLPCLILGPAPNGSPRCADGWFSRSQEKSGDRRLEHVSEFQLLLFLASSLAGTGPQGFLHHRTVPGCLTCPGRGEDPALGGGGAHLGLPGGPGVPQHASTQAQLVLGPLHGRRAPLGASLMCSPGIRPYPSMFAPPRPPARSWARPGTDLYLQPDFIRSDFGFSSGGTSLATHDTSSRPKSAWRRGWGGC